MSASSRLKVLISAYACEPGRGSEPEVGWQWATQVARLHDVTVLTRANNREPIERGLAAIDEAHRPRFVFHDVGPRALALKRRLPAMQWYYAAWQSSARRVVAELVQRERFDVLHHATFAGFRYDTAIWDHGLPAVWGPLGGGESVPTALLPWRHPRILAAELARNFLNSIAVGPIGSARVRGEKSAVVLAATRETAAAFARCGVNVRVFPTIGFDVTQQELPPRQPRTGALRLLYVGNLLWLKGLDLALHALAKTDHAAELTLLGDGPFRAELARLCAQLGIASRVHFRGRVARAAALAAYREFDVLLFPSLHDSGGLAVLEAMANELPAIVLDCGGPALSVREGCGRKVPLGSRNELIRGLAHAIDFYTEDPARIAADGARARRAVEEHYSWEKKAAAMDAIYREAAKR